jgi:hypothetical protein
VLEDILGAELIKGSHSLQGLLGFSAVAHDSRGLSSIHPQRTDLIKSQRAYGRDFADPQEMRRFSQIDQLEQVIADSCVNFEVNIVESNKRKVLRLLSDTLVGLQGQLTEHRAVSARIAKEIAECQKTIRSSFTELMNSFGKKRTNALDHFFNELDAHACEAIEEHFSDKDDVERTIQQHLARLQKTLSKTQKQAQEEMLKQLSQRIELALKRLQEDVARVNFQHDLSRAAAGSLSLSSAMEAISFSFADVGGLLFSVGSYALTGFTLGSVIPGLGNVLGAVIGGVIGVLASALKYFFGGRGKKIADAQAKVSEAINEERQKLQRSFGEDTQAMRAKIKQDLDGSIFHALDEECRKMAEIGTLFAEKIASIQQLKTEVEAKPHGTI